MTSTLTKPARSPRLHDTRSPLTRKALAVFQRWCEAQTPAARAGIVRWAELSQPEIHGLERFRANLQELGRPLVLQPDGRPEGWFEWAPAGITMRLKKGIVERLLAGLWLQESAVRDLVRAVGLANHQNGDQLEAAIRRHCDFEPPPKPKPEPTERGFTAEIEAFSRQNPGQVWYPEYQKRRRAAKEAAPREERREQVTATVETVEQNGSQPASPALKARVLAELERRGVDIRACVPQAVRRDIARALGIATNTLSGHISALRKEQGISLSTTLPASEREPFREPREWAQMEETKTLARDLDAARKDASELAKRLELATADRSAALQQAQDAENRVLELRADNQRLEADLSRAESRIRDLADQVTQLREQLAATMPGDAGHALVPVPVPQVIPVNDHPAGPAPHLRRLALQVAARADMDEWPDVDPGEWATVLNLAADAVAVVMR